MDVLIDADVLVYRFSFANESVIEFDPGDEIYTSDLDGAIEEVDDFIDRIMRKTGADFHLLCLSDRKNFRKELFRPYKANRKTLRKPQLFLDLKNHMQNNYRCKVKPKLEADDVMGIMATREPGRWTIATIDKDLLQIPGRHYNWNHRKITEVSPEEADYWFYFQTLCGDVTDNFKGCPDIGPARAKKLLDSNGVSWATVKAAFAAKDLDEDHALTQARMARILRAEDYNYKKGEPILWTPPDAG